jgi:hypothetical protein
VTQTPDRQGFVRAVQADGVLPPVDAAPRSVPGATRAVTITRLAVLKAAAEFAAGRHNVKSGDVLRIAASWERWINRDPDDPDLTDVL